MTQSAGFRNDIQGLRALAVLAVLGWHAGIPGIDTGYIGVDVFFVISGYLISSLLIKERAKNGKVDLWSFYGRRAKRLLPAASFVIVATVLLTLAFVPKIRWRGIADDAIASSLYFQNWSLASGSVDYLNEGAAASPLQHYWSLAVEEQFYFVWPLLLVLATPRGSISRGYFRKRLFGLVGVVVAASFVYSVLYSASSPGPAYFATTTRAWQFAVGAGVAVALSDVGIRKGRQPFAVPSPLVAPLAALGVVGIVGSALVLPESQPFPGWIAAVPTLATAAVILAGGRTQLHGTAQVLGSRPLVWIGGLSYPLYLWHWPLLITLEAGYGPLNTWQASAIVFGSVVPSILMQKLLEEPLRHSKKLLPARWALGSGAVATAAGLVAAVALIGSAPSARAEVDEDIASALSEIEVLSSEDANGDGAPLETTDSGQSDDDESPGGTAESETTASPDATDLRLGALAQLDNDGVIPAQAPSSDRIVPDPLAAADDRGTFIGCSTPIGSSDPQICNGGDLAGENTIVLVGDSIAHQWATGVSAVAEANGWSMDLRTKSACSYTGLDVIRNDLVNEDCVAWNAQIQDILLAEQPEVVVFTGRDRGAVVDGVALDAREARAAQVADHLARWGELRAAGIRVVVLAATPNPSSIVPECVSENLDSLQECTFAPPPSDGSATAMEAAALEGGFDLISMNENICGPQECPVVTGEVLVYRDGAHLSDTYVRTLVPFLAEDLQLSL